ncbi:MAG TPA: TlpA disulfide reductase family protein [Balneolaceae bacterium]
MKLFLKNLCFLSILLITVIGCENSDIQEVPTHEIITNVRALDTLSAHPDLKAPDFTLTNMEGEKFSLSEYRGKVVVLNHWATWCGFCIEEIPDFIQLQEELRDEGVVFVGISPEKWSKIESFAKEKDINYIMLRDDGAFDEGYELGPYPTTYIINKRGEIAYRIKTSTTKELLKPLLVRLAEM